MRDEIEQVAHALSHDLRAPLREVRGRSEMLRERVDDPQVLRELDGIVAAAARLQSQSEDLAQLLRLRPPPGGGEAVDLHALAQSVAQQAREAAADDAPLVEVAELPAARGDAAQLRLLLEHLVANACKFVPGAERPRVRIHGTEEADLVCVRVQDRGIGLEERFANCAFDVFRQLQPRTRFGGNGIGLALVRKIAENHGGSASIEQHEGPGITVCVRLAR